MSLKKAVSKKRKQFNAALVFLSAIVLVFSAVTVWGNVTVSIEKLNLKSEKLGNSFDGFKIAHISDYHNTKISSLTDSVIESLKAEAPDIIVITGDVVDCRKTDIPKAVDFVREISAVADVYYVTGNHECNVSIYDQNAFDEMIADFEEIGVSVLRNEKTVIERNGKKINVFGIDDPYFRCSTASQITEATKKLLADFEIKDDEFNLLLAHHPEQVESYEEKGFDLVFSGHAHGGQGRLFGIGLIAPDQGLFPEYSSGEYFLGSTTLVVSRGIGNSIAPVRIFDRPHLIYTIIK